METMKHTTGPMRSSSEGLVGTPELRTVAECAGSESATTAEGRGATDGGGDATGAAGFGTSQVSAGTLAAAAALPRAVARTIGLDEDGAVTGVAAEGRGAEGMAGLGGVGAAALRMAAMSTFPTGV